MNDVSDTLSSFAGIRTDVWYMIRAKADPGLVRSRISLNEVWLVLEVLQESNSAAAW